MLTRIKLVQNTHWSLQCWYRTGLVFRRTTNANNRVFIKHRRSENSPLTTQNSPAKFCLFRDRALPFHNNSPVTFQYSPVSPILNETPGKKEFFHLNIVTKICVERKAFFSQLSCVIESCFGKSFYIYMPLQTKGLTHVSNQQCNDNNNYYY